MKRCIRAVTLVVALLLVTGSTMVFAAGNRASSSGKGYKIAWSTIYLTPSWMQETKAFIEKQIEKYKGQGLISEFRVVNANGETSQQIAQIENLIAQKFDALVLIAGSSTALNTVVEKAHRAGMVIVNIDSLVTTDQLTSKINTSQIEYGGLCAQFAVDKLGSKGNVIIFNGPAGVSVSEERRTGAKDVLAKNPNITVLTELFSEYNEGPCIDIITPALDAYKNVDAIIALGGAQASSSLKVLQNKGMKLIPITGENYNSYLKEWASLRSKGFSSFAVAQPNWLGTLAVEQCIRALQGQKVNPDVVVPLPIINDNNLGEFVPNSYPDDYFPVKELAEAQIADFLK